MSPLTDAVKLAQIADLCDRADDCDDLSVLTEELRAILDAPSVGAARAGGIDRDALGEAWDDGNAVGLDGWVGPNRGTEPDGEAIRLRRQYLDTHAPAPAPPALDLAVVRRILTDALPADPKWAGWVDGRIEEIAAHTPSAGVVLTAEERAHLVYLIEHAKYSATLDIFVSEWFDEHGDDLAARLGEVSS